MWQPNISKQCRRKNWLPTCFFGHWYNESHMERGLGKKLFLKGERTFEVYNYIKTELVKKGDSGR
jgi:hypothetical protein